MHLSMKVVFENPPLNAEVGQDKGITIGSKSLSSMHVEEKGDLKDMFEKSDALKENINSEHCNPSAVRRGVEQAKLKVSIVNII